MDNAISSWRSTDQAPSPFHTFARAEWAALRNQMPAALGPAEIDRLRSLSDHLDMQEVEHIYLPLARLLSLHVDAAQALFRVQQRFLGTEDVKVPYLIGIAGSVSVGKSTTARVLQALLARQPHAPTVELVTTDGFLYPNAILARDGRMDRKGFPESYDRPALLRFLRDVKAGQRRVSAPVYSHLAYDVVPGERIVVDHPDILIVEGLNVLQWAPPPDGRAVTVVSDFLDFSIYVDADEELLRQWYIDRFLALRATTFRDPRSHFHRYAGLSEAEAVETAGSIWARINLVNLRENIVPTRQRAHLILRKGASHRVEDIALRRL